MTDLDILFTPHTVGSLNLRNRFVLPAMQRGFAEGGNPGETLAGEYVARAKGGCGLIITESTAIDHPSASAQPSALWLREQNAEDWRRCLGAVRNAGSEILVQLWHEGGHRKQPSSGQGCDQATLSPSGFGKPGEPNGRAATTEELRELRDCYVDAARLAQRCGASGVEVHSAHGYFLDQMLWDKTNLRQDAYGGPDVLDRMQLHREIVEGIRATCGRDFAISLRFSQWKESDYSASIFRNSHEIEQFVTILRKAGVDAFHASTRRISEAEWPESTHGLAGWTGSFTDASVIGVGSVGVDKDVMVSLREGKDIEPRFEQSLAEVAAQIRSGAFDLVAVGRSQLGDPFFVEKVRQGRFDEIRPFSRQDIAAVKWDAPKDDTQPFVPRA